MTKDDEVARKAKAERLRQQISRLTNSETSTDKGSNEETNLDQDVGLPQNSQGRPSSSVSPREFIQRRMKELDEGEN